MSDLRAKQKSWLSTLCQTHALSLTEVARHAGISPSTLTRFMVDGATSELRKSTIAAIEKAFPDMHFDLQKSSSHRKGMQESLSAFDNNAVVKVEVPAPLLEHARQQGLDIPALLAEGGVPALRAASKARWYKDNGEAIEANRRHIETYGTFAERHGVFPSR